LAVAAAGQRHVERLDTLHTVIQPKDVL
jgi:hypothetical protein